MNKRGQFFLIAALVIIVILIGLASVYNAARIPAQDEFIFDLSKEINFESGKVIDSGILYNRPEATIGQQVETITDYYANANLGNDFIIVYGNQTNITVVFYRTENTGSVGIGIGNTVPKTEERTLRKNSQNFSLDGDKEVTIIIQENVRHTFEIKPGQIFFVIIQKEKQGERYVSASERDAGSSSTPPGGDPVCGDNDGECPDDCTEAQDGDCPPPTNCGTDHIDNEDGTCTANISIVNEDGNILTYDSGVSWSKETASLEIIMDGDPSTANPLHIGYIEWDVSEIPDGATITNVLFGYEGTVEKNRGERIRSLSLDEPAAGATASEIWAATVGSTLYCGSGSDFVLSGINDCIPGSSNMADVIDALQANLDSNVDRFAVQMFSDGSPAVNDIRISSSRGSTIPTLIVTYTP